MKRLIVEQQWCLWVTGANEKYSSIKLHSTTPTEWLFFVQKLNIWHKVLPKSRWRLCLQLQKKIPSFPMQITFCLILQGRRPWYVGAYCLRGVWAKSVGAAGRFLEANHDTDWLNPERNQMQALWITGSIRQTADSRPDGFNNCHNQSRPQLKRGIRRRVRLGH